jgi:hypothetical protein
MRCRACSGITRVVCTEHHPDGTHRWLRCLECGATTRTLERYLKAKPGPKPGITHNVKRNMGSSNSNAVLTEDDVRRLRHLAASGVPQKNLAQEYGVAIATVSRIVTRKQWAHI